jgi:Phage integrase, N-terminal SAM-like domain/Phage integrase family
MREVTAPPPPSFPSLIQRFFTEYLVTQRALSPRTIASYRDSWMLFLDFAHNRLGKLPTALCLADIEPNLILAFLNHLEQQRQNSVQTRNVRLAALRAFLKFAARRDVSSLHVIERALGVPTKRFERPILGFLSREEILAVIGQPGDNWTSQRDHLLLATLYNTGARVSEIVGMRVADVVLDGAPCVHLHGKGRKQRSTPLWNNPGNPGLAAVQPNAGRGCSLAAQPRRRRNDTLQCHATSGHRRCSGGRGAYQPHQTEHLASHHPPFDGNASASVRRRLQRDCSLARPREYDHDAPIRRGQPGNEGKGLGQAPGTRHENEPLSAP